jgi:heme exporter protein A
MALETSDTLLEVRGLAKHFQGRPVLKGLDFDVRRGETVVVYGANGAGKTSFLRILATLSRPSHGTLRLAGESYEDRAEVRFHLLYLGHATQLYDDLTPEENLRFFLGLYGRKLTAADLENVLRRVGLWRFRHVQAGRYSAGMKRRLSLARAMLLSPALLLLDEPYTSLDTDGVALVNEFIEAFRQAGGAVVMSSHSPELVAPLTHRAVRLIDGKFKDGNFRPEEVASHVA